MNHLRYALSEYTKWFSGLAIIIGVIAVFPLCKVLALIVIGGCVLGALIFPLLVSFIKKDFTLKVIGNSKVTVHFGDLFEDECFLVTSNRFFDVDAEEGYISKTSLLGLFVERFYDNNIDKLKQFIKDNLELDDDLKIKKSPYGKTIGFRDAGKYIYIMAFTDRKKTDQPKDFYYKAVKGFLNEITNANHGMTIAIPLIGDDNTLSNSGFSDSMMTFEGLISVINSWGIENPRVGLKLKIVILPKKRSELIAAISKHT